MLKATDTARQTFYNHFRDINELISYVYMYNFEENYEKWFTVEGNREIFAEMKENKCFYGQLPSHKGQNNFRETHLRWLQRSYYRDGLDHLEKGTDEYYERKALIDGFLYGIVGLMFDWFEDGMEWPADAIINFIFENRPDFIIPEPGPDFTIVPLD